ncbi:MAG: hypothetical protein ACXVHY_08285 [Methanobacterium sp.]
MKDDEEDYYRHRHNMFPYGRLIFALIIGIILIFAGVSALLGIDVWQYFWPIIAILLGLLIIIGAIFGRRRRY